MSEQQLVEELHKPFIRKEKKRKEKYNHLWGTRLADMQLISTFNKGFRFLLCAIDIYCKYVWVIRLKDKKKVLQLPMHNTDHSTIKTKPVGVKPSTYNESSKEINYQDPKFKIGDIVRISKYKNIFAKGYVPNWYEDIFVIKKIKNTVLLTYVISDLKGEKKGDLKFQKMNQKGSRVVKVIKNKGDKLYVKWKDYDSSFNS